MEKGKIQKWIGGYLKGEIDSFVFTCLMALNHICEKDDIPGKLKSHLVIVMTCLQSCGHLSKKEEQAIERCLVDIMKVPLCDKAKQGAVCETAMEKIDDIIAIANEAEKVEKSRKGAKNG
jgi:hypothetical protein